jgi:hypothetical protein
MTIKVISTSEPTPQPTVAAGDASQKEVAASEKPEAAAAEEAVEPAETAEASGASETEDGEETEEEGAEAAGESTEKVENPGKKKGGFKKRIDKLNKRLADK